MITFEDVMMVCGLVCITLMTCVLAANTDNGDWYE
jgi:hypothetical protein